MLTESARSWPATPAEAVQMQRTLAHLVVREGDPRDVRLIAGLDVSFPAGLTRAAAVLLTFPGLELVETSIWEEPTAFPYVPGLLSFREAPSVLRALDALSRRPDLVIVDGHGIAHPRRFGLASHIGLLANVPTIGCAKSLLVGGHGFVGEVRGSASELTDGGDSIGIALRSRDRVRPVYVSVGHRISVEASVRWILACCTRFRLPEPQRQAHLAAGRD